MSDLDEIGKLDELDQHQSLTGAEFSDEEAQLLDELLASADISLPPSPEVRPDPHMTGTEAASQYVGTEMPSKYIGAETWSPHLAISTFEDEVASAPAVLDESPGEEAIVAPLAYDPTVRTLDTHDDATALDEDNRDEPVALDQYSVEMSDGLALGSARQDDQPADPEQTATVWNSSPVDETTTTETPDVESVATGPDALSQDEVGHLEAGLEEHPHDEPAETRQPGTALTLLNPVDQMTAVEEDPDEQIQSGELQAPGHERVGAAGSSPFDEEEQHGELAAEHEPATAQDPDNPVDQMTAVETLPDKEQAQPVALETVTQVSQEVTSKSEQSPQVPFSLAEPMTYAGSRPRRRPGTVIVAVIVAILCLATLGAGFLAVKQSKSTSQWRQRALNEVSLNGALVARDSVLSKALVTDRSAVASQEARTSKLTGQVSSLQAQLATLSKTREKTLAKNVLTRLQSQASAVSNWLGTCVNDTTSLRAEIDGDLAAPNHKDPHLQANTQAAGTACATARRDDLQVQSTLRGAR